VASSSGLEIQNLERETRLLSGSGDGPRDYKAVSGIECGLY
jgi:hypothetical protein